MLGGSGGPSVADGLPVAAHASRIAEGRRSNLSRLILSTCCWVVTAGGTGAVTVPMGIAVAGPVGRGPLAAAEFELVVFFNAAGSARGGAFKGTALMTVVAAFCWPWEEVGCSRQNVSNPRDRNGVALMMTVRNLRLWKRQVRLWKRQVYAGVVNNVPGWPG